VAACSADEAVVREVDSGESAADGGRLDSGREAIGDASFDPDAAGPDARTDADVGVIAVDAEVVVPADAGERSDAQVGSDAGDRVDGGEQAGRPHPLYPALDLDTLPGDGGGSSGPYQTPALPITSRTVTVDYGGFQAQADVTAACQVAGTAVVIPNAAGRIPGLDLGSIDDCDISLGADVFVDCLVLGDPQAPGPVHRVRVRGGQLGSVVVAHHSTDVVFDGVVVNSALIDPVVRSSRGVYLLGDVDRFAFVSSVIRMAPTMAIEASSDGNAFLAHNSRNVFFANNNIATAGNRDSSGFDIRGGQNYVIVDNSVRVSFDAFVRLAGQGEDYVYIKGGTFMREATLNAAGQELNHSFVQNTAYGSEQVFVHDPIAYLLPAQRVSFGSAPVTSSEPAGSWQVRRITWHARSASVVSDRILQDQCFFSSPCDYGLGGHTYVYDEDVVFPASPWRELPSIADGDPDHQPTPP